MFGAPNVHYEVAERTRGFAVGGIGAIQQMARSTGLIEEIDRRLHLVWSKNSNRAKRHEFQAKVGEGT